ncbi:hypothetical protein D3C87_1119920 [compost metagenome]
MHFVTREKLKTGRIAFVGFHLPSQEMQRRALHPSRENGLGAAALSRRDARVPFTHGQ